MSTSIGRGLRSLGPASRFGAVSVTRIDDARRWFHRHWTLGVGAGAHVRVNGLLEVTRELAEDAAGHRAV